MIDSVNVNRSNYNSKIAFKAQNDGKDSTQVAQPTQSPVKKQNTHYGLIAGGTLFSLLTLLGCLSTHKFPKALDSLEGAVKCLGCGAIVDFIINKKKNAFNEKVQSGDKTNLKNAAVTKNGNIYYSSKDGKKIGSLLGAVAGAIAALTNKDPKYGGLKGALASIALMSIGGSIMGSITDKLTNKRTIKDVDANA